ncbi:MAG: vWA domain-containing protein [Promethearchaeota archaeon]
MVRLNVVRSEDTIIALDFYPKNVKLKVVKDALNAFMNKKSQIDNSDRFNLVLFRGNPSYLEDFTYKKEYLLSLINEDPKHFNPVRVESFIFMALTFLIEVFKKVGNKFFRLIILTDQDMKPIEQEFMVKDLLRITRDMPVFIDIIRLNMTEGKDPNREKLKEIISWSQGGELIYIPKIKKLEAELIKLAEKKFNENEDVFEEVKVLKINPEHADFYENIAQDPRMIQEKDLKCMACFDQGMLFECPVCQNAKMHENCWAFWSKSSNIGIRHIFRCPICYSLLKLPPGFVEEILGAEEEVIEEAISNIEVSDQDEILREKDKETPNMIESLLSQFD